MSNRVTTALLILVIGLACGLRLFLASNAHATTLDTAVVGQMALDILQGERPLFFAGQNYMGALEAYLLAAFFYGLPVTPTTMTLATISFSIIWIIATFVFFRIGFGNGPALAAALAVAFPGWSGVWYSTAPYGGYPQTYVFGLGLLCLAVAPSFYQNRQKTWLHAALLALLTGLGIWTNLQVLPYLAAALILVFLQLRVHRNRRLILPPYALVPLALIGALVPQWLAERAHVHPPMFDGLSLKLIAKSWQGLWTHDLAHNLLWTFEPVLIHRLMAALIAALVAVACYLALRHPIGRAKQVTACTLLMLVFFSLSYFPHPMSGFVPRYLIAPVTLLLSWALAVWTSQQQRTIARVGYALAVTLSLYNAYGTVHASLQRSETTQQTVAQYQDTMEVARQKGWNTLMHTGSETEGYDGIRFTLLSQGEVLVTSAFSDRFLKHQLAWEFGAQPAYLARKRHLPFIEGSYTAMQSNPGVIDQSTAFALIENPAAQRRMESSVLPDTIEGHSGNSMNHPLFDRDIATTWTATMHRSVFKCYFSAPTRLGGLRVTSRDAGALPYRYVLRVQLPDGRWQTVQEVNQRIAASYLSGQTVYFRGHHPWMDIRIPPMEIIGLSWEPRTGSANNNPAVLTEMYILADHDCLWPDTESAMEEIRTWLETYPAAELWTERGVMRQLHRHAAQYNWPSTVTDRIPLPYNPRFSSTQMNRTEMPAGSVVFVVEAGYESSVLRSLQSTGSAITATTVKEPLLILKAEIHESDKARLFWDGFTLHARQQRE